MKARMQKLKILKSMIFNTLQECFGDWKAEVWVKDLDDWDCCNGKECMCGGHTVREKYS